MKSKTIINFLEKKIKPMRKSRIKTLGNLVTSLLSGGIATLTQLGRHLPGNAKTKHKIKRVDRFLGNPALNFREITPLILDLLPKKDRLLVIVDWTPHEPNIHQTISAKIPIEGRCLPLLCRTHIWEGCDQKAAEEAFLEELHELLPPDREVIVIADRGFKMPFWKKIKSFGWDFIGRLQENNYFKKGEDFRKVSSVKVRPGTFKDFGFTQICKGEYGDQARLIIYKAPKNTSRSSSKSKKALKDISRYRKTAKQPWYLVTSLQWKAEAIISGYAQRFQIEETFRDWKNHRFCGYNLKEVHCSNPMRLERLLMVIAVGYIIQIAWGLIGSEKKMELYFRANRSKKTNLSIFYLGGELLRKRVQWRLQQIGAVIRRAIQRTLKFVLEGTFLITPSADYARALT